jgi:hypothetical protein
MKTNSIVFGPLGSGKSTAIRTLLAEYPDPATGKIKKGAGLGVRVSANDPGWKATNGDLTCSMNFHVMELLPANPNWADRRSWLEKIQDKDGGEEIKKMNIPNSIRRAYRQFMDLHVACENFVCDECGEKFGNNEDWDDSVAFVNDGLSGITKMAKHFLVGPKPALTWPDIDAVGHSIEDYIDKCVSLKCSYILISHWDKEPDKIEGGMTITLDTIGNKLAPRLLKVFDEIILAVRKGNVYSWNMADDSVEQKARRLEYKSGLAPDFSQIFAKGV